ncbi:hypothetical protein OAG62_00520 [bacterium]|nr:hypothetical protein [bacterium]
MDAAPDYFWQRAAENALVQRFHRRPQDADRRMRAEIVVAMHDDVLLHRFEPGSRPPINDYRQALAQMLCAIQKLAHTAAAEIDLFVEYLGPLSETPSTAKMSAEARSEFQNGDSRLALIHLGRLIPSLVSHHPTPFSRISPLRESATEYDRRVRLQLGQAAERAMREIAEDEIIECVRDSRGGWQVGVPGSSMEAHGLDLKAASELAAARTVGIIGLAADRPRSRTIEWSLAR